MFKICHKLCLRCIHCCVQSYFGLFLKILFGISFKVLNKFCVSLDKPRDSNNSLSVYSFFSFVLTLAAVAKLLLIVLIGNNAGGGAFGGGGGGTLRGGNGGCGLSSGGGGALGF